MAFCLECPVVSKGPSGLHKMWLKYEICIFRASYHYDSFDFLIALVYFKIFSLRLFFEDSYFFWKLSLCYCKNRSYIKLGVITFDVWTRPQPLMKSSVSNQSANTAFCFISGTRSTRDNVRSMPILEFPQHWKITVRHTYTHSHTHVYKKRGKWEKNVAW